MSFGELVKDGHFLAAGVNRGRTSPGEGTSGPLSVCVLQHTLEDGQPAAPFLNGGQGCQQSRAVWMTGGVSERLGGQNFHQVSGVNDGDAIGQF